VGIIPFDGDVEVDETMIGGKVQAKRGRSQTSKKQVAIASQKHPKGGISSAYAKVIQNAGTEQLLPFIESDIDKKG
jgi:hypothetical protein